MRRELLPYCWMLLSSVAFALMGSLGHALGSRLDWPLIALGRSVVPLVLVTALALGAGVRLAVWRPAALWAWSVGASVGMLCTFFALTRLPVSDVFTLTNTYPIGVALLSWPLLRERPSRRVWLAAACGVAGVFLIQRPLLAECNVALFAALGASLATSVALLALHCLKELDERVVLVHFSGVALLFSAAALLVGGGAPALPNLVSPGPLAMLVGVGLTAVVGQFLLTRALAEGAPARVSVVGLTQIVFAMALDVLLFGRSLEVTTLLGTALVVAPTAWVMAQRREEKCAADEAEVAHPAAVEVNGPEDWSPGPRREVGLGKD